MLAYETEALATEAEIEAMALCQDRGQDQDVQSRDQGETEVFEISTEARRSRGTTVPQDGLETASRPRPHPWRAYTATLIYTVNHKKQDTNLLFISSANIDGFSMFFHCYTQHKIWNKTIITDPNIPKSVATLPCEALTLKNDQCRH